MKKEHKLVLNEFVSEVSSEELKFLCTRLSEKMPGDLPEVLDFLNKNPNVDSILKTATSGEQLYDLCDNIQEIVLKEAKKRNL